jgi:hypothetical protein
LALALLERKKFDEAEALVTEVLRKRTHLHGMFNEATLNSEEHLAWCWKLNGDHTKATEKLAIVEQKLQSLFREDRPSIRRVSSTMKSWKNETSTAQ